MGFAHTRQLWGNIQQQAAKGAEWLVADHGEFQHAIPVSLAIPLRRRGSPRSRILEAREGERSFTGVVQTNRRSHVFLG